MGKDMNTMAKEAETGSDKLAEMVRLSMLYDFYGELLGEHNKQIFEAYVLNDLTLSEVADEAGISRQGVHDIVKRCSAKLTEYENKLHLVGKFELTKQKVNQIKLISEQIRNTGELNAINIIDRISDEILNDL